MFHHDREAGHRPGFGHALDAFFAHHQGRWGTGPRPGFGRGAFFGHHGPGDAWGEGEGRRFGPFGRRWGGPGRGPERLFERGDLKYVILDLLQERPRHGYDVIRALEERYRGFYSPSPGSIYPILQLLEDQGFVSADQQDGKRVYSVTEAGRAYMEEHAEEIAAIRARTAAGRVFGSSPDVRALFGDLRDIGRSLARQAGQGSLNSPERVLRVRAVLARARDEIADILVGETGRPPSVL